jgi:hypothetical protein
LVAASATARETLRRQRLKLPGALNPLDAAAGVDTEPFTETDRGATTTTLAPAATTMQGRTRFFGDAPVSASWRMRMSPTVMLMEIAVLRAFWERPAVERAPA